MSRIFDLRYDGERWTFNGEFIQTPQGEWYFKPVDSDNTWHACEAPDVEELGYSYGLTPRKLATWVKRYNKMIDKHEKGE
jgi:hypothetical protein